MKRIDMCEEEARIHLRDDGRSFLPGDLFQIGPFESEVNQRFQGLSRHGIKLILRVLLDVHAHGSAHRASPGEAEDDSRAVLHHQTNALLLRHGFVDGIAVFELVAVLQLELRVLVESFVVLLCDLLAHGVKQGVSGLFGAALVVVAGVVVAAVLRPMSLDDTLNSDELLSVLRIRVGKDRKPCQNGPHAVLLANMVGTCSEGLLPADRELICVHEITEVLPSGGDLVKLDLLLFRYEVHCTAGRHGACATLQAVFEVRDAFLGFIDDDCQRIGWSHKELLSQDHVPVGVAISCSTELRNRIALLFSKTHGLHEVMSVCKVWIRMPSPKVLLRLGVEAHLGVHSEFLTEDLLGERTSNTVHGVIDHGEILAGDEFLELFEVKDLLHHVGVSLYCIDHLNVHWSELVASNLVVGEVRNFLGNLVVLNLL
mmetsp:Transcript_15838/g.19042  ORF Transcript_15838/g.19042 Transcript_15838/m.19042 type:complete len:428 (+) Transcript_15838:249-1532(+)